MLSKNRRVRKEFFSKIIKEGVFVHSDVFYLKLLDRKDNLPSLFSFVVPIKVKKTSVGRHLIKRKMSVAVEKLLISLKPGFSCLVFTKKDVSRLSYKEIEKEILALLKRSGILELK
jgi:ribonuclease P protein component